MQVDINESYGNHKQKKTYNGYTKINRKESKQKTKGIHQTTRKRPKERNRNYKTTERQLAKWQ